MDVKVGMTVSGVDIYGKEVTGEVTGTADFLKFATIKCGKDRLDKTVIDFKNIKVENNI
jgi:hypothetical protein